MVNPENCVSCQNPTITSTFELCSIMDQSKSWEGQLCPHCFKTLKMQLDEMMIEMKKQAPNHPIWEKFKTPAE